MKSVAVIGALMALSIVQGVDAQCYNCTLSMIGEQRLGQAGCGDPFNSTGIQTIPCASQCATATTITAAEGEAPEIKGTVRTCHDPSVGGPCMDNVEVISGTVKSQTCCTGPLCNDGPLPGIATSEPQPGVATEKPHVYEPECESLDAAIQSIHQAISSPVYTTVFEENPSINCTRDPECDGFRCNIDLFEGGKFLLAVELRPCQDPPQMLVLLTDPNTNMKYVEQTVTHGDSFNIPGLEFRYIDLLNLSVKLRVHFQPVPQGLEIGLSLGLGFGTTTFFELPLLPPIVINTPPCSTQWPSISPGASVQCVRMQSLMDSLNPPNDFMCMKNDDCKGFKCHGAVVLDVFSIPVTAEVIIDSCTRPVSMTILIDDYNGHQVWSHVFTHSENVRVEGPDLTLPPGVTADMNVTLQPYTTDIDYWITTIELIACNGRTCMSEKFIDRGLVPIPPCGSPPTSGVPGTTVTQTPRPPSGTECLTWEDVARRIESSGIIDENDMGCMANRDCDGITCDMVVSGRQYNLNTKLFHCENPVRLRFNMDSVHYNCHLANNITEENSKTPVSIDCVIQHGELKFYLIKRTDTAIEIAILLRLPNPGSDQTFSSIPLLEDQIIPIEQCPGTQPAVTVPPVTVPPVIVTKPSNPGTKPPTKPPSKPGPHAPSKPGSSKNPNAPEKHKSNGAVIGVVIGVVAVVAAAIIIIAVLLFRRRSRPASENLALVEDDAPVPI